MKNRSKALRQVMKTDGVVLEMAAAFYNEFFVRKDYDWWYEVQPGDVVVDLGACVGMMSAHALDKGASKVYMVEGNRELLKTAISNVSEYMMNEPDPKVYPVNCIIGSSNGVYKTHEDKLGLDEIDHMTFKEFIDVYDIPYIDYLKIDIEGSEYDILNEENRWYLMNNVKHMAIEIHTQANEDSLERFIEFRDTVLSRFKECPFSTIRCMGDQNLVQNLIWQDKTMRELKPHQSYFMLYITNDHSRR